VTEHYASGSTRAAVWVYIGLKVKKLPKTEAKRCGVCRFRALTSEMLDLFTTQSSRSRRQLVQRQFEMAFFLCCNRLPKRNHSKNVHAINQNGKAFHEMFFQNMCICAILRNKRRNKSALRSLLSLPPTS